MRFLEDGREWRLPDLLYADGLVLCGKSEQEQGNGKEVCRGVLEKRLEIQCS